MSEDSQLQRFLQALLEEFRKEWIRLDKPQDEGAQYGLYDLRPPCQLIGFSYDEPEQQSVFVTHSPEVPDMEIHVFENLEANQERAALEACLDLPVWQTPIEPDGAGPSIVNNTDTKLRAQGLKLVSGLQNEARLALMNPREREPNSGFSGFLAPFNTASWIHGGALSAMDPTELGPEFARSLVPREPQNQSAQPPANTPKEPEYKWRGAYHSPKIKVASLEDLALSDYQWRKHRLPGIEVHRGKIAGIELVATHNGFFALRTSDDTKAMSWLSLLMVAFIHLGIPSHSIAPNHLGQANIPDDSKGIGWGGKFPVPESIPGWETGWVDELGITIDDVEKAIQRAEEISKIVNHERVPDLLQAYTHHSLRQPSQSLIFSWAIIEDLTTQAWDRLIDARGIEGPRKKDLRNTRAWPFQNRIDTLEIAGAITSADYRQLVEVKKVRNRVMHGGAAATEDEAFDMYDIAHKMVMGLWFCD